VHGLERNPTAERERRLDCEAADNHTIAAAEPATVANIP
jgi:hypothetical protein